MRHPEIEADLVNGTLRVWFHCAHLPWKAIPLEITLDFDLMGRLIAGEIISPSELEGYRVEPADEWLELYASEDVIAFRLGDGNVGDTRVVGGDALVDEKNVVCGFQLPLSNSQMNATVQLYRSWLRSPSGGSLPC